MRDSRPWWLYHLSLGVVFLAGVWLIPDAATRDYLQLVVSLAVIPAVIVGIRLHRPAHRPGWWLLAAGVSAAVLSNVAYPVLQALGPVTPAVDLIYYLTFPFLGAALAIVPGLPRGKRSAGFTEAGIITSGAAVIWWTLLVDPLAGGGAGEHTHVVVFPLLDMALLALALRLLLLSGARSPSYLLLTASCSSLLIADTAKFVFANASGFVSANATLGAPVLSQVLWMVCNVTMGAAALHPSMARPVAPPTGTSLGDTVGASRIYIPTVIATPILAGVFLVTSLADDDLTTYDVVVPVGATALTSALVVVRMRQLNVLVRERAADLERSLRSEEVLQLELLHRAQFDEMTGLPNRSVLHDRLTSMLRHETPGRMLILDLDEFKEINDRYGHAMGDDVLVAVAERLRQVLGEEALIVRLGSDEFGALFSSPWEHSAELLVAMRRPFHAQGHELFVTASVGIRDVDPELLTGDVLRDAYVALHAAKAAGRDQAATFDRKMREQRLALAETVERLRGAVARDELVVYFQPLVRLADERMVGVEALLRWKPPGERMVPPDQFIPIAEDSGLIVPIGAWVLRESCRVVAPWHHAHGAVVSVNVSPRQLREPDFGATVLDALRSTGLPPAALILEITEGVLVDSGQVTEQAIGHLSMLRAHGVRVAVDDFGTGYSSLAYLRDLPIDHIKIDRSFMPAPGEPDPAAQTLVKAIIDLATGLGLGTIAEGVETEGQVELLRSLGCERAQGFFFARPVPAPEAAELLATSAARDSSGKPRV